MKQRTSGFTLTELLITIAIVAILTSIAVPSYLTSVQKSRRNDAKTAMVGLAQVLERRFTNANSYTGSAVPAIYPVNVPTDGTTPYYVLSLVVSDAPGTLVGSGSDYLITATRAGAMANDPCGNFRLSASGARSLFGGSKTVAECWQ